MKLKAWFAAIVVGRVVDVLVGDAGGDDGHGARLVLGKVRGRVEGEVVGPPLTVAAWRQLVAHSIVNHVPVTLTGSLKVIEMFAARATPIAPFAGVVDATVGARSTPGHAFDEPGVEGRSRKSSVVLVGVGAVGAAADALGPPAPLPVSARPTPDPSVYGAAVSPS